MQVESIVKRTLKLKSFRVEKVSEIKDRLEITIVARRRSLPICSLCSKKRPRRDTLHPRRWRHVKLWGIETLITYSPRRVNCPDCGIVVEKIPWSLGKSSLSLPLIDTLQRMSKHLSFNDVARLFGVSWNTVRASVKQAVEFGLAARSVGDLLYIGVDEIASRKGHTYVTMVYDLTEKKLLAMAPGRNEISLYKCFQELGKSLMNKPLVVCCDMWRPYIKIIREDLHPETTVVFDKFHIIRNLLRAVDEVRREEYHEKKKSNPNLLKRTRYLWLKNPQNLKPVERQRLGALEKLNLKVNRAYLLKESLREFWQCESRDEGEKFLRKWFWWATHSRLKPMRNFAWSVRKHQDGILSWFDVPISNGAVEGMNGKAKAVMRRAYGFRTFEMLRLALLHNLGKLPEPKFNLHKFL
ncbi:MAG: ISL3 family transposase [Desulfosporosinus sp.]|nr:ISL3 family transposase [Desulfosporosinus sp.]